MRVNPGGVTLWPAPGESVFECAQRQGVRWPTTCHGQGSCHMCFMSVTAGAELLEGAGTWELEGLAELGEVGSVPGVLRLACQTRMRSDADPGEVIVFKRGVRRVVRD
nr:2Fe-2S iron-sulfur cluster-binding protein [Amycolatopsis acidicola]